MYFLQYETGSDDRDRRLDRVLRRFLPDMGLGELYKAIRKGLIRINDRKTTQNYRIQEHDVIGIADFLVSDKKESHKSGPTPNKRANDVQVLFRNEQILIINKPYNISVQKADKNDISLDDIVKAQFPSDSSSLSFSPGPLHRLDKKTTGVLCFSQNLQGARRFSSLIQTHEIKKSYTALLSGTLTKDQTWTDYISRDSEQEKSSFHTVSVTSDESTGGKESITIVHPVASEHWKNLPVTLARIEILTGRTHQIRSQCAQHGFPLLGDTAYGGPALHSEQDFFLHAISLSFPPHSELGTPSTITAPLPEPFFRMLKSVFPPETLEKIDFLSIPPYNNV